MALVATGQLRQVADPNRPGDRAFESPRDAFQRILVPLGESAHVTIVGGPTNPNGDVYWQVADSAFPGCCAPFGWVRESTSAGTPAIAPFAPACPDATVPLGSETIITLGTMEAASCFGTDDFTLHGTVECDQDHGDTYVAVAGPRWTGDRTECHLDGLAVYGPAVTSLYALAPPGRPYVGPVQLKTHFNDASSVDCTWTNGSLGYPLPTDAPPLDTAQFACRMSIYVTSATPVE